MHPSTSRHGRPAGHGQELPIVHPDEAPRHSRAEPYAAPDGPAPSIPHLILRMLPPPERFAAPLRLLPEPLLRHGSARLIAQVLAAPLAEGRLDEFAGRRIGVEVTDLGLRWVIAIGERRFEVLESGAEADATVRGTATDLLMLSSRLEDADTLFFHRRLQLTGDVELGLALRNMLDQLPWESIPLGLRIVLNRGARFARYARSAYRGTVD